MKTISVRDLSQKGASKAVAAAESEPVLVSRNNEPAVWMLGAAQLARVAAALDGDDEPYRQAIALLAVDLFNRDVLSLGRAARLAGMSLGDFIDLCGALRVPVLRTPPEGFEGELAAFERQLAEQPEAHLDSPGAD